MWSAERTRDTTRDRTSADGRRSSGAARTWRRCYGHRGSFSASGSAGEYLRFRSERQVLHPPALSWPVPGPPSVPTVHRGMFADPSCCRKPKVTRSYHDTASNETDSHKTFVASPTLRRPRRDVGGECCVPMGGVCRPAVVLATTQPRGDAGRHRLMRPVKSNVRHETSRITTHDADHARCGCGGRTAIATLTNLGTLVGVERAAVVKWRRDIAGTILPPLRGLDVALRHHESAAAHRRAFIIR